MQYKFMKIIKNKYSTCSFLILFIIVCLVYLNTRAPIPYGDGTEYILQAVSFERSYSFGVTKEDISKAKKEFKNIAPIFDHFYDNPVIAHRYKNAKYFNHYGLYSALVVPIKKLFIYMGYDPIRAFHLLNLFLLAAALLVIHHTLNVNKTKKSLLLLLIAINPAFFYLDWVHTEIFLYTFVIIALVFYYNKKYISSLFFINIAATQNLAVLPFAIAVEMQLIIENIIKYKLDNNKFETVLFLKKNYNKILLSCCCFVIGIIPMISTYSRFHVFNLVADVARENKYLVQKCFGYLFDLNLGILPYEPVILTTFLLTIIIGIRRLSLTAAINLIGLSGIFYIVSNQHQINCGMQYIMRYNVWIIPIMIFYVVLNWELIWEDSKCLIICSLIQVFYTACIILFILFGGGSFNNNEFAPWTRIVLNNYPGLYNPVHGIFYSRASGAEMYHNDKPVGYINHESKIKKVLLSKNAEPIFYSNKYVLIKTDGNLIDKATLQKVVVDGGDYSYININQGAYAFYSYQLGEIIYFYTDRCDVDKYIRKGLSMIEDWGRWTDGYEMQMAMYINSDKSNLKAKINIASVFYKPQRIIVLVNDKKVFETVVDGKTELTFDFPNPKSSLVNIKLLLPDATRPKDVMNSPDQRLLSIGLRTMIID